MIESGQQFGLYVVKDVFVASEAQASCCAEDPFFNRDVTLTTFSTEPFLEGDKLEQLEALLERLAILDHPSIAPIYDSGLEENSFYYTSACFCGTNLSQRLAAPLAGNEALKVVFELTQALDYAHELGFEQGRLCADNIYFDDDGQALLFAFGIDSAIEQIIAGQYRATAQPSADNVAETLHSLGELLLQMLLGPAYAVDAPVDDLCAAIDNSKIRCLIGRFLLPGESRFVSFTELLEELRCFDDVAGQLSSTPKLEAAEPSPLNSSAEEPLPENEQAEKMVAEVRRLVAEKNGLQQALDSALYERNQVDEKLTAGQRQLALVKQDVAKAKEEANVAWELVAGQKYDRWRPMAWAVGGFVVGFILSGSYGYYYSEQTRTELLAKLKANEELIKTAAWRPAEQELAAAPSVAEPPAGTVESEELEGLVTEAEVEQEALLAATIQVEPVAEDTQHWWPAGSEFSAAAAIPIEQIRAALGLVGPEQQTALPDRLRQEVTATVRRWAESWSRQDLSSYFSAYSEDYRPELGRSQQQWRDIRRSRVTRPQWIELDVDDLRVRKLSEDRIQVKLKQSYRSDYYQDQIFKSINLIKEDGEWRILMERSLGMISNNDIVGG